MRNILFITSLLVLASAILVNAQEDGPKTGSPFSRHPYIKLIGELPNIASYRDENGKLLWDKIPENVLKYFVPKKTELIHYIISYPKFIEAMREEFERVDENEDGYLYKGELLDWVIREKLVTKDPEESIDAFMASSDKSKDKKISLKEFLEAAEEYVSFKMIPARDVDKMFSQLFGSDSTLQKLKEFQDKQNARPEL